MAAKTKPLLMTQADAAALIGVPTHKLLRWVRTRAGGFPTPVKIVERTYLFSRSEVERWARLQTAAPEAGPPPD